MTDLAADLAMRYEMATEIGEAGAGTAMITSQPRYQYFGRAYGFDLTAVEWDAATPPSEEEWDALPDLASETGAEIFVWEAAPSSDSLARMEEIGLRSAVFPPMANRPAEGDFLTGLTDVLEGLRSTISAGG